MYLPERKRAQLRKCMANNRLNSEKNKGKKDRAPLDSPDIRKVSQILFDARDGREVFTPF